MRGTKVGPAELASETSSRSSINSQWADPFQADGYISGAILPLKHVAHNTNVIMWSYPSFAKLQWLVFFAELFQLAMYSVETATAFWETSQSLVKTTALQTSSDTLAALLLTAETQRGEISLTMAKAWSFGALSSTRSATAMAIVSIVFTAVCLTALYYECRRFKFGWVPRKATSVLIALTVQALKLLALPAMAAGASLLNQGTAPVILGAAALVLVGGSSVNAALMHSEYFPRISRLAMSHARVSLLLALGRILLGLFQMQQLRWQHPVTFCTLVFLTFLALAAGAVVLIPFYRRVLNSLLGAVTGGCAWTALFSLIISKGKGDTTTLYILALAGFFVFAAVGFLAVWFEQVWYRHMLTHQQLGFKPFQLQFILRHCFTLLLREQTLPFEAVELLKRSRTAYPDCLWPAFLHGMLISEQKQDPRVMILQGQEAAAIGGAWDTVFILGCHVQNAHDTLIHKMGEGNREVNEALEGIDRNIANAKACASKFWHRLMLNRGEIRDTDELITLVDAFGEQERAAYGALTTLIGKYPTSFKILRKYARYLDELKNDKEASSQALILADQFEEEEAVRKARRHNREDKKVVSFKPLAEPSPSHAVDAPEPEDESEPGTQRSGGSNKYSLHSAGSDSSSVTHLKAIRRKIESTRFRSIQSLKVLFPLLFLLLFLCLVCQFVLTTQSLNKFASSIDLLESTIGFRETLYRSLFLARKISVNIQNGTLVNETCKDLLEHSLTFESYLNLAYVNNELTAEMKQFWSSTSVTMKMYIAGTNVSELDSGHWEPVTYSILDSGYAFLHSLRETCGNAIAGAYADRDSLETVPSWRLVMDNGPLTIANMLASISVFYPGIIVNSANFVQRALLVITPIALALALLSTIGFFWVLRKIRVERRSTLGLFARIPRSTLLNITEKIEAHLDSDTKLQQEVKESQISSPVKFAIVMLFAVAVFFVMTLGIMSFGLQFVTSHANDGIRIRGAGTRRNSIVALAFWAQEVVVADPLVCNISATCKSQIRYNFADTFTLYDRRLKYGDRPNKFVPYIDSNKNFQYLWYERDCPDSFSDCRGLGMMIRDFYDSYIRFFYSPQGSPAAHEHFLGLSQMYISLTDWLKDDITLLFGLTRSAEAEARSTIKILFWVYMPSTLILVGILFYLANKMGVELEQMVRMLIFLPLNVLETVGNIKTFIEQGANSLTDKASEEGEGEEFIQRILAGCEEAVVITDKDGRITFANESLAKLTGYAGADLLEMNVNQMVDEKFFKETETTQSCQLPIRNKDNVEYTVLASISRVVRANGQPAIVFFFKDITELQAKEDELRQKQKAAEGIIYNILPKTLVKAITTKSKQGRVVASAYQDVTVLFATVVDFTHLTAGMDAEETVLVLNELVSSWDRLSQEFAVEKIKTIGETYMCCAGAPVVLEESADLMVEFAIAMLGEVETYNKTHKHPLQIRIGINTGKVVAGVLGLHKICFDLWGDTVNVASRMQSNGLPGRIQVSEATYNKLKDKGYKFESRGKTLIKGKGEMECFMLDLVGEEPDGKIARNKSIRWRERASGLLSPPQGPSTTNLMPANSASVPGESSK